MKYILPLLICTALYAQEPNMKGKALLYSNQEGIEDVRVFVDGLEELRSDANGLFDVPSVSSIANVEIVKRGYELSTWNFNKGELIVYLRPTSTHEITGSLVSQTGEPQTYKTVFFDDNSETFMTRTNESGDFALRIPYKKDRDLTGRFRTPTEYGTIKEISEDLDRASYEVMISVPVNIPYQVTLVTEQGEVFANQEFKVNGKAHQTDEKGQVGLLHVEKLESYAWELGEYQLSKVEIDQRQRTAKTIFIPKLDLPRDVVAKNKIELVVEPTENEAIIEEPKSFEPIQKPISDTSVAPKTASLSVLPIADAGVEVAEVDTIPQITGDEISRNIDGLLDFYVDQKTIIEEKNKQILDIADSVQYISTLTDEEQQRILEQLLQFDESLAAIDSLFEDTRANSLNLIMQLRAKLQQQEQEIKVIEEEKQRIAEEFQKNIRIFLAIIGGILALLIVALWIIRRFSIQKQLLEATRQELLKAQNIATIGSMVYDIKKNRFTYSDDFFKILRIKPAMQEQLLANSDGVIHDLLIHTKDRKRVQKLWKEGIEQAVPIQVEFKGMSEGNRATYFDLNTQISLDSAGRPKTISATIQDITEKKEHEIKLVEAIKTAEEASRIKDQFLSSMSHEIRTPLNAIIGLTDFLITDKPKKAHEKKLNTVHFSSQHLLALVNDILDFNKIKAGKLKIDTVDFWMENLLEDIINSLSFSAREKGLDFYYELQPDLPRYVTGDNLRINQILINLIGNAIKFTDVGEVKVCVSMDKDRFSFKVKDTGIGIAEDKLEKIFEGFEQEDASTSRKYGGTGLGLSISKELSKLLGGSLEVNSVLGEGSEFTLHVPMEVAKEPKGKQTSRSAVKKAASLKGLRVLCVEDNEINQMVIDQYLERWGIITKYVETGTEALAVYEEQTFDLVFMDIRLPDMNGYEVTKRIVRRHKEDAAPIIGLTAEIDEKTEQKIKKSGMTAFLGKPFNPEDLKQTILKYTNHEVEEEEDLIDLFDDVSVEEDEPLQDNGSDVMTLEKPKARVSNGKYRYVKEHVGIEGLMKRMPAKGVNYFKKSFSIRIDEFRVDYEKALYEKDIETLDSITHKILPNLKLMDLEKMCVAIKKYKKANLEDDSLVKEMVEEVDEYRVLIKECLTDA